MVGEFDGVSSDLGGKRIRQLRLCASADTLSLVQMGLLIGRPWSCLLLPTLPIHKVLQVCDRHHQGGCRCLCCPVCSAKPPLLMSGAPSCSEYWSDVVTVVVQEGGVVATLQGVC